MKRTRRKPACRQAGSVHRSRLGSHSSDKGAEQPSRARGKIRTPREPDIKLETGVLDNADLRFRVKT